MHFPKVIISLGAIFAATVFAAPTPRPGNESPMTPQLAASVIKGSYDLISMSADKFIKHIDESMDTDQFHEDHEPTIRELRQQLAEIKKTAQDMKTTDVALVQTGRLSEKELRQAQQYAYQQYETVTAQISKLSTVYGKVMELSQREKEKGAEMMMGKGAMIKKKKTDSWENVDKHFVRFDENEDKE